MSDLLDAYMFGTVVVAVIAALGAFVAVMNGSIEGWRTQDYRFAFAALAALVAAPVWPATVVVALVFLRRRAFPPPTVEALEERIRRAEREAGL